MYNFIKAAQLRVELINGDKLFTCSSDHRLFILSQPLLSRVCAFMGTVESRHWVCAGSELTFLLSRVFPLLSLQKYFKI